MSLNQDGQKIRAASGALGLQHQPHPDTCQQTAHEGRQQIVLPRLPVGRQNLQPQGEADRGKQCTQKKCSPSLAVSP